MSSFFVKPGSKIYIATTGISEIEIQLIKSHLPPNVIYEDTLSSATTYLFTFRGMFTDKYIQALKWKIPIFHIEYLYSMTTLNNHAIPIFGGVSFTSSGVSNDIFKNFFILQGGKYKEDIDWSVDFLVSEYTDDEIKATLANEVGDVENDGQCKNSIQIKKTRLNDLNANETVQSDKIRFALKYDIPIINSKDIFSNNYILFKRNYNFYSTNDALFENMTLYLDKKLPERLFNALKRGIIEKGGFRVSQIEGDVDFFITSPKSYLSVYSECKDKNILNENKIIHYQYIFDSIECKSRLLHHFYVIHATEKHEVLKGTCFYIDKNLNDSKVILTNKIKALGGTLKNKIEGGITHMVIKNKREYNPTKKIIPYKVVLSEWIDQCLFGLRYIKEDKYLYKKPTLSLFQTRLSNPKNKVIFKDQDAEIIFQFTGLSTFLKEKAIQLMKKHSIKFIDSDKFDGCTHLIMGMFNTSEKFMCSVGRGNWILIPDFINDYDGSRNFNFERYEWNENIDKQNKLLGAIKKWRVKVAQTGKYAFDGWKVKIYCEEPKRTALVGLIESANGVIVDDEADHVFVSKKYNGDIQEEDYHSINYIYTYLLK